VERVTMPQLGETVTEGTVVRWLKQEGDAISVDEALFDVSTDKVDAEVPSAFGGVIRALLVAEGDTVPVGTPVALIGATADEPLPDDGPPAAAPAGTPANLAPQRSDRGRSDDRLGRSARSSRSSGSGGETGRGRVGSGVLTPAVRQLLDEHDLQPDDVVGSGRDGRVTRSDVLAAAAQRAATNGHESRPAVTFAQPGPDDTVVPFSRPRSNTAVAMSRSRATAAHALVTTEVDYLAVDGPRRAAGLTYLPFVGRALIDAVAAFPNVNASVGDECLIVHPTVHLGVAVDLDREVLVVPVARDAADLRLTALSDRMIDLADRARRGRLSVAELDGATITVTNVGAYGTVLSAPIIPLPQVAILSTDGVRMRPVARAGPSGEWAVAVHPVGNLSLSFDHRAIDGAYAAAFLARVREIVETRAWAEELRG
jgi:2-oxoglutarate dehydrogenase E2 component (dihydrolipoamide succinyltransferase)